MGANVKYHYISASHDKRETNHKGPPHAYWQVSDAHANLFIYFVFNFIIIISGGMGVSDTRVMSVCKQCCSLRTMAAISLLLFAGSMSSKLNSHGGKRRYQFSDTDSLAEKLCLQTVMSSVYCKQTLRLDTANTN